MVAKNIPVVDEKLFPKETHQFNSESGRTEVQQKFVYRIQIERVLSSDSWMHFANF